MGECVRITSPPTKEPVTIHHIACGLDTLNPESGAKLIRRVVSLCPRGVLAFDCVSSLALSILPKSVFTKATGATMEWAVNNSREVEKMVEGYEVKLVDDLSQAKLPWVKQFPFGPWLGMCFASWAPAFRI